MHELLSFAGRSPMTAGAVFFALAIGCLSIAVVMALT